MLTKTRNIHPVKKNVKECYHFGSSYDMILFDWYQYATNNKFLAKAWLCTYVYTPEYRCAVYGQSPKLFFLLLNFEGYFFGPSCCVCLFIMFIVASFHVRCVIFFFFFGGVFKLFSFAELQTESRSEHFVDMDTYVFNKRIDVQIAYFTILNLWGLIIISEICSGLWRRLS